MLEAIFTFIVSAVVIALVLGFAILYSAFSWGLVAYKFWYWFLLPVFPSMPHINYWQAMGLFLFIGLFNTHVPQVLKKEYTDTKVNAIAQYIAPWLTLLAGYVVLQVIGY